MNYVKRPQRGEKVLQSLFDSVNSIIDYLPTLTVRGDNYSTYVEHSSAGTIIHSKQPANPDQSGGGKTYAAGSGLTLSGNIFYNALSGDGTTVVIRNNVISAAGGGGGPSGPDNDTTYTGEYNVYSSGWISVDSSGSNPHLIYSNLRNIEQLYNYPLVASSNIVMPNSLTACNNTVDISQVGSVYSNHYIQTRDIFHDGAGTRINFSWMKNPFGDQSDEGTNAIVQGLQVDLTLSGGRYTDVILHKHVFGTYDPNSGDRYDPPDESRVDCLITGTYDHYPHTSGFIDVVPVLMEDGKTWGVISTNLHAGSGITIDEKTGEISCTGGGGGDLPTPVPNTILSSDGSCNVSWQPNTGGGQGGGGGCFWPMWENLCGSGNIVLVKTWYTTSTGGWLRISNKTGTTVEGCNSVYIDPTVPATVDGVQGCGVNHIGLGTGINTHVLPVPPGSSFYIEYPSGDGTRCWFDGSTSPNKTNTTVIEGSSRIINASDVAVAKAEAAQSYYNTAYSNADSASGDYTNYIGRDNIDPPTSYKDWYYNAYNASNAANTAADEARQAAISCQNVYNIFTAGGGTISDSYVTNAAAASGQAAQYAADAHDMVLTAGYYYDLCYNHYQTCPNHSGWFADNPDFERYDD